MVLRGRLLMSEPEKPTGPCPCCAEVLESLAGSGVPEHIHNGIARWVSHGIDAGDFVMSLMEDRLVESFARADAANTESMRSIVAWLWGHCPAPARGRGVDAWRERGGSVGRTTPCGLVR